MEKHDNNLAFFMQVQQLIQYISIVPMLIALNVLNVTEIFLEKIYLLFWRRRIYFIYIHIKY